jgi:hypothetical protein
MEVSVVSLGHFLFHACQSNRHSLRGNGPRQYSCHKDIPCSIRQRQCINHRKSTFQFRQLLDLSQVGFLSNVQPRTASTFKLMLYFSYTPMIVRCRHPFRSHSVSSQLSLTHPTTTCVPPEDANIDFRSYLALHSLLPRSTLGSILSHPVIRLDNGRAKIYLARTYRTSVCVSINLDI